MSAAKSFVVVAAVALFATVLASGSASAQGGAPNPSGGTSALPTVHETSGRSLDLSWLSDGSGLRGWFLSVRIARQTAYFRTSSTQGRTQLAAIQRRLWER